MIRRYDIVANKSGVAIKVFCPDGHNVGADDYAALFASHARLLEAARCAKMDIAYVMSSHPEITGQ
jgi:hypothetical protein